MKTFFGCVSRKKLDSTPHTTSDWYSKYNIFPHVIFHSRDRYYKYEHGLLPLSVRSITNTTHRGLATRMMYKYTMTLGLEDVLCDFHIQRTDDIRIEAH